VAVVTGPLLVLADCYRDAFQWAMDRDLGSEGRAWRYVWRPDHVQGLRGGRYVLIGRGGLPMDQFPARRQLLTALAMAGFDRVAEP
jgi:hypothetical protein